MANFEAPVEPRSTERHVPEDLKALGRTSPAAPGGRGQERLKAAGKEVRESAPGRLQYRDSNF